MTGLRMHMDRPCPTKSRQALHVLGVVEKIQEPYIYAGLVEKYSAHAPVV